MTVSFNWRFIGSSSLSVVQDAQHGRSPAVYNNILTR